MSSFSSLWGWTLSGGWQPGQTEWRVWTFIQLSHGCWPVCTTAVSVYGTTKHRYDHIVMDPKQKFAPHNIEKILICNQRLNWQTLKSSDDVANHNCFFPPTRLSSRPLKFVTSLSGLLSLWQGRTGWSLGRWEFHPDVCVRILTAVIHNTCSFAK